MTKHYFFILILCIWLIFYLYTISILYHEYTGICKYMKGHNPVVFENERDARYIAG